MTTLFLENHPLDRTARDGGGLSSAGFGENTLRRIRRPATYEDGARFLRGRNGIGGGEANPDSRIRTPLARLGGTGTLRAIGSGEALEIAAASLRARRRVIGIGSPRAPLESNLALRTLVGPARFYLGVSAGEYRLAAAAIRILQNGPARFPSLEEAREADAVLVLGEDVADTAPLLARALSRAADAEDDFSGGSPGIPGGKVAADGGTRPALFLATPGPTGLDGFALWTFHAGSDDLARFGAAVAHAIDPDAPRANGLSEGAEQRARAIAAALTGAKKPLVVSGTGCGSEALIRAAADIAGALCRRGKNPRLSLVLPEPNSLGLALMGGGDLRSALRLLREGGADTVIILENDLTRRDNPDAVASALSAARTIILIDHTFHAGAALADLVFPAATIVEESGTLLGGEGRPRRFTQVLIPEPGVQSSRRWLEEIEQAASESDWAALSAPGGRIGTAPWIRPFPELAPPADLRMDAEAVPCPSPRHRWMPVDAEKTTPEAPLPDYPDSGSAFFVEEGRALPHPMILLSKAAGWNAHRRFEHRGAHVLGWPRGEKSG